MPFDNMEMISKQCDALIFFPKGSFTIFLRIIMDLANFSRKFLTPFLYARDITKYVHIHKLSFYSLAMLVHLN